MSKSDDGKAKCPYFEYSEKNFIKCQKIIEGSTRTAIEFIDKKHRQDYQDIFCFTYGCWQGCIMARVINGEEKIDEINI